MGDSDKLTAEQGAIEAKYTKYLLFAIIKYNILTFGFSSIYNLLKVHSQINVNEGYSSVLHR